MDHERDAREQTTAPRLLANKRFGDDLAWNLVDAAPDGIVVVDEAGAILLVNRQTEELFGYERGELLGRSVDDLLPEHLRNVHATHRAGYRIEPRRRAMGAGNQLVGRRKDGTEFPTEISLSPMRIDDDLTVIAVVRDITDRVAVEEHLREAQQELHTLEDHERIARDLHDIVIQQLFASGMTLQGVWSRIREPEVAQRIATVVDDLDRTIREIRSVIFGLQSFGADANGLRVAIIDVVNDAEAGLQSTPHVHFDGPVELVGDTIAAQLLPTLREALSNVARHANATTVEITVGIGDDVVLCVADDGVGIDDDDSRGTGNGIRNMMDRAARLGGRATICRRPEGGTLVEWRVPS